MTSDLGDFERLVEALRPWLDELVIVGGWAHRLHHEHPQAERQSYQPVRTRDADVAFGASAKLPGKISRALSAAGFREEFTTDETPPVAQYFLGKDDQGFYAEFLTPMKGSGTRRDGSRDVTVSRSGITAQKLRHLEVLFAAPWQLKVGGGTGSVLPKAVTVHVANPAAFIAQKLLIHGDRRPRKQAQDILYIHDTIQVFGAHLDEISRLWREQVQPTLTASQTAGVRAVQQKIFAAVSEAIREAARIPADRSMRAEDIRAGCELGLSVIFPED